MIPLEWKLWAWMLVGLALSVAWVAFVGALVRPATRRATAWWMLPAVAVLFGIPAGWLFALWLGRILAPAAAWMLGHWWLPLPAVALAGLAVYAVRSLRAERQQVSEAAEVASLPAVAPAPTAVAVPDEAWSHGAGLPRHT